MSREWTYDDAYRLTSERQLSPLGTPQSQSTFTYDATGNRLSATTNGQTTSYTYNDLDQMLTAGSVQYSYDGRGNLTQVADGIDVTLYSYNAAEQLTSVTLPDGTQISYTYDSSGRRVSQNVGTQVINYLWDEASPYGDVLLETDSDGNALVSYVLGGSQLLSQERDGTVSYYLHDGQRSVRTLTDNTGAISDQYSYSAFGELEVHSGTTTNGYLYTGQQYDDITGLYSLRARYYEPTIGRLLSRDPAELDLTDPSELNRYVYVANNPVNAYDPTGLVAATEYMTLHSDVDEEAEGLYVEGRGVNRVFAQTTADFNAIEARLVFEHEARATVSSTYRQITSVRGQIIVDGQTTEYLAVSDFPPVHPRAGRPWRPDEIEKMTNLIRDLKDVANRNGWHYAGPDGFASGGVHAEQYVVRKATELGIKQGDTITFGVSNPGGPCTSRPDGGQTCRQLIQELLGRGIDAAARYINRQSVIASFP